MEKKIFQNFLFLICKIKKKWSVKSQKKRLIKEIKNTVETEKLYAHYQVVLIAVWLPY